VQEHLVGLSTLAGTGGAEGVGTGWASTSGWIVALAVVVVLAALGWWATSSARRRR
jgi:hypothetical protein